MALIKSHIPWAIKIENFPAQSNTLTYDGTVQSPTWNYTDFTQIEDVGGTDSATTAGTYYKLYKPLRKYVFPNGTKKIYYAPWVINKAKNKVTLSETSGEVKIKFTRSFTVSRLGDGVISATSSDDSIAKVSVSGNTVTITGISVGDVTITVSVAEGTNYLATSTTYACKSRKTQITVPTVSNTSQAFHGYSLHPTVTNAPSTSLVTRTGTYSATAYSPTPYSFTYTIKDTDAYEWSDGTTAPKTYSWRINKAVFPIPAQSGTVEYNDGYPVTPTWNFSSYSNAHLVEVTHDTVTETGTYPATFHLPDTVNCQWSDGSTTDKTAYFTVGKKSVTVPTQSGTLTYNPDANQSPSWNNYDAYLMTLGGTTSGKDAKTYNATFTLVNNGKNHKWADGVTSASHTAPWVIDKEKLDKPYVSSSDFTYSGAEQEVSIYKPSSLIVIEGTTKATDPGTYTATGKLPNSNYTWRDGTTANVSLSWKINGFNKNDVSLRFFYDFEYYTNSNWYTSTGNVVLSSTTTNVERRNSRANSNVLKIGLTSSHRVDVSLVIEAVNPDKNQYSKIASVYNLSPSGTITGRLHDPVNWTSEHTHYNYVSAAYYDGETPLTLNFNYSVDNIAGHSFDRENLNCYIKITGTFTSKAFSGSITRTVNFYPNKE